MIPLRDNIPSRTVPVVNYAMIGLCALAFIAQLRDESDGRADLVEQFGMIPQRVFHPTEPILIQEQVQNGSQVRQQSREITPPPFTPWLTLLTCIFLHGGWMHFLGNVWILYIFGDNVEDRIGHFGYFLFYIFCGLIASGAHLAFNSSSPIPTIGASGAIAGVMGAYFLFYPHARVVTLIPIIYLIQIIELPAPVFLGIWFLLQFFQGTIAAIGSVTSGLPTGGVAWWAHIGGFAAGCAIAYALRAVGETSPPVEARRDPAPRLG
jgi:membrane associated rhomboid family serine protease